MEVSSNEKVVVLFQGFMEYLKDKYNSVISNDQVDEKIVVDGFDEWCQKGNFFEQVRSLFEIKKYSISNKEKYQFLKYALIEGHSNRYGDAYLLSPEMIPLVDFEYVSMLLQNSLYKEVGNILSNTNNLDLVNSLRNTDGYKQNSHRIVRQITLPENLNYQGEVPSNKTIDIFNQVFDDACVMERWPSKIDELIYSSNNDFTQRINYLNQDNLISLAESLWIWGDSIGDDSPYQRAQRYREVIGARIVVGTLMLYDYQSPTLNKIKLSLQGRYQRLMLDAPYTNYILDNLVATNDEILDKRLKKIIRFNPNLNDRISLE